MLSRDVRLEHVGRIVSAQEIAVRAGKIRIGIEKPVPGFGFALFGKPPVNLEKIEERDRLVVAVGRAMVGDETFQAPQEAVHRPV